MLLATTATPLLQRLDPERAHRLAVLALRLGLAGSAGEPDPPALAVRTMGLSLPNPIGLAAGFDKAAAAVRGLRRLGFGAVETGTVTRLPQPGNPRPRVFRLEQDRSIINRYGFNSEGLAPYLARLGRLRRGAVPVGANVGLNKAGANPERDYPALIEAVAPLADYLVINLSSPNTPGLRDLQGEAPLGRILAAIADRVPRRPPLLIKLAPDLSEPALEAAVAVAVAHRVDGLILGNTTLARPPTLRSATRAEPGGLSGPPLMAPSTQLLARAYATARGRLALVGCGGIASGADVLRKIRAGADFVQLYTAFAYDGPALLPRLKRELLAAMREQGFDTVQAAVGTAS